MAPANSKMKAPEMALSKWMSLPLRAWNDMAEIKMQFPHWSEGVVIANALHFFAAAQEKARLEAEQKEADQVA